MNQRGVTLIELLVVIGIIAILAAIAIPSFVGYQKRAARAEAFANLEALRVLEEQYFAQNGTYAPSAGTCAKDNNNISAIQGIGGPFAGFKPGEGLQFSYCIENGIDYDGNTSSCFRMRAFGNSNSKVNGDEFRIDCNNKKNF